MLPVCPFVKIIQDFHLKQSRFMPVLSIVSRLYFAEMWTCVNKNALSILSGKVAMARLLFVCRISPYQVR
jgi:hypothetical protein